LVLGGAYQSLGDRERMVANFRKAYHLSPSRTLLDFITSAEAEAAGSDAPEAVPLVAVDSLPPTGDQPDSLQLSNNDSN
jgi:hypothetical protein